MVLIHREKLQIRVLAYRTIFPRFQNGWHCWMNDLLEGLHFPWRDACLDQPFSDYKLCFGQRTGGWRLWLTGYTFLGRLFRGPGCLVTNIPKGFHINGWQCVSIHAWCVCDFCGIIVDSAAKLRKKDKKLTPIREIRWDCYCTQKGCGITGIMIYSLAIVNKKLSSGYQCCSCNTRTACTFQVSRTNRMEGIQV